MTFEAYELSSRGGKPTHLFVFTRQSLVWRFASNARDVVIDGKTYQAAPIKRSNIRQNDEGPQKTITITLAYQRDPNAPESPVTQGLGDNWFPYVPRDPVHVACLATHLDDPDQEIVTEWLGDVVQPKFHGAELELQCGPPGSIADARYQGAKFSVGCWKTLHSKGIRGCNLDPGPHTVSTTLDAVRGPQLTANAWTLNAVGWVGGTVTDGAGTATITAAAAGTLTMDDVSGMAVNDNAIAHILAVDIAGNVTAVSGSDITAAEYDVDDTLVGGTASWIDVSSVAHTANVTAHVGQTVTLDDVIGIAVGITVTLHSVAQNVAGTITAIGKPTITAAAFADQTRAWVDANSTGFVTWTTGTAPDEVAHSANLDSGAGGTLVLDATSLQGLAAGDAVVAHTTTLWVQTAIDTIDGATITAAALVNAPFNLAGGWINWVRANGIVERRSISTHEGDTITLIDIGPELAVGTAITAIPNCPHTWAACEARGNTDNFGGSVYKPVQNPFDGESMSWS